MPNHKLPEECFDHLASGLGGPGAVERLRGAQESKRLLLLRRLIQEGFHDQSRTSAVDVLVQAQRTDQHAFADLMNDPMVGAWLVRTLRKTNGKPKVPVHADIAQLGALAAAAAYRIGLDTEVQTQTLNGAVTLPTVGTALLGSGGPAVVTVADGRATVTAGSARVALSRGDPGWLELRRLSASHRGLEASLLVEDGNPYRDCYHAPPADRLSIEEVGAWQAAFTEAWRLLVEYLPERAVELAAGLRSVVPLVLTHDGMALSGTARDMFGALGLTRPRSGYHLAVTLVHEFQHSKLSALLDLEPLYTLEGEELHFAPWRTDARPTAGLFQGVYAFLGVADVWRALRAAPELEELATREFALCRELVEAGLSELERSEELTPLGRAFAAGLRRHVLSWHSESMPAAAVTAAEETLEALRRQWRHENAHVVRRSDR
jgi:uncharacterized protein